MGSAQPLRCALLVGPVDLAMAGALFLKSHVFLCRGKRHWVILDVHRDKYLCVDRRQFEALGPSLQGWENRCDAPAAVQHAAPLAEQLLGLGILSESAVGAKDALTITYPLPTEAFDPELPAGQGRFACAHAGSFFISSAQASRQLGQERFQDTVELVQARKHRNAGSGYPFDLERARVLVAVFERLRLFYPRPYLCLFDSLALLHFLARFGLYPDWVFGINSDPFEAHCWVQAGTVVLNDRVARVSGFTPIMCV